MFALRARDLGRHYGNHRALEGLNLDLRPGEVLGILGPNGAGKSTAMRMLTGTLAPSAGSIEICGIDLIEDPVGAKTHLGYLPEIPPLYRELTVNEYLRLAALLHRVPKSALSVAVGQALKRCGLEEVAKRLIGSLSKGYQQRVGIAQAIVHTPSVVILDEPTAGLDPLQIRDIRSLIKELGHSHGVILSTHILAEAEALCDQVMILHQGRAVFSGSMAALLNEHDSSSLEENFVRLTLRESPT